MSSTAQRILILAILAVGALLVTRSLAGPAPPPPAPQSLPEAQVLPTAVDVAQLGLPSEVAALFSPREVPQPNPNATWAPIAEFSGEEAGRTPTFELSGSLARVRYKVEGDLPFLVIFFVPDGQEQVSGFPDVLSTNESEGEATVAKPPGRYHLSVQTIGATWTVAVEEERAP